MLRCILFDFDGSLADSLPIFHDTANKTSKKLGYKGISDAPGLRDKSIYRVMRDDLEIPIFGLLGYIRTFKQFLAKDIESAKLVRGLRGVLKELRATLIIGVLTSNSEEAVQHFIKRENIEHLIDFVVADVAPFRKHRSICKVLDKYGFDKDEVIYVGDELRDVVSCKKCGVRIAAVTWGFNSKKALGELKPDFIVDQPKDLLKLLN